MTRYVALLRGINVGGKNLIGMPALKARFEAQGFTDVVSYIQSGNILFTSSESGVGLMARIEADLSKQLEHHDTAARAHGGAQRPGRRLERRSPLPFETLACARFKLR